MPSIRGRSASDKALPTKDNHVVCNSPPLLSHTVDGQTPAPPNKPWCLIIPLQIPTNHGFNHDFISWCEMDFHSRVPPTTKTGPSRGPSYQGAILGYHSSPYTQYPLFSGYDVDRLLKKEVFTLENRSAFQQKYPEKSVGIWSSGFEQPYACQKTSITGFQV